MLLETTHLLYNVKMDGLRRKTGVCCSSILCQALGQALQNIIPFTYHISREADFHFFYLIDKERRLTG